MLATKNEHNDVMEVLIKNGADVNTVNKEGVYPLHVVAEQGSVERLDTLWSAGNLQLNVRNKQDATPLVVATEHKNFDVVRRLVELGAGMKKQKVKSLLY